MASSSRRKTTTTNGDSSAPGAQAQAAASTQEEHEDDPLRLQSPEPTGATTRSQTREKGKEAQAKEPTETPPSPTFSQDSRDNEEREAERALRDNTETRSVGQQGPTYPHGYAPTYNPANLYTAYQPGQNLNQFTERDAGTTYGDFASNGKNTRLRAPIIIQTTPGAGKHTSSLDSLVLSLEQRSKLHPHILTGHTRLISGQPQEGCEDLQDGFQGESPLPPSLTGATIQRPRGKSLLGWRNGQHADQGTYLC